MDQQDEVPAYLLEYELTANDFWEEVEWQISDFEVLLKSLREETKNEALTRVHQKKRGQSEQLHWLKVQFDHELEEGWLAELLGQAEPVVARLRAQAAEKVLDHSFALNWGQFRAYVAEVEAVWYGPVRALNHIAGAEGNTVRSQVAWYSRLFLLLQEGREKKGVTENRVIEYITDIIADGGYPELGFEVSWFQKIVNEEQNSLRKTFANKGNTQMSLVGIKRWANEPAGKLPPLPQNESPL